MTQLSSKYWEQRYVDKNTGWDVGEIVPQWKVYFDELAFHGKEKRILIPGAGLGHEAEYLHHIGFKEVHVLDWSTTAIDRFKERIPSFPVSHCHVGDFFTHKGTYDIIVEQTFFCAIDPQLRQEYVRTIDNLLGKDGIWVALLFNTQFEHDGPPFGGSMEQYLDLFKAIFKELIIEEEPASIEPRKGREVFMIGRK